MHRTVTLKMGELNKFIKCPLCKGYLIDSFTVNECMHTFCKSCIIRYVKRKECCPVCQVSISKDKKHLFLRKDVNFQFMVYKLVPNLFKKEMKRRRDFYAARPEAVKYLKRKKMYDKEAIGELDTQDIFLFDDYEDISLSIEYADQGLSEIRDSYRVQEADPLNPRSFLQCPANLTVKLLKKFLFLKFSLLDPSDIDVMYDEKPLSDDLTLMDIAQIYAWRRTSPMRLFYCKKKADETIKNSLISLTNKLRKSFEINTDKLENNSNEIPKDGKELSEEKTNDEEQSVHVNVETKAEKKQTDEKLEHDEKTEQAAPIEITKVTEEEAELIEDERVNEVNNQNENKREYPCEYTLNKATDDSVPEKPCLTISDMVASITQKQNENDSTRNTTPQMDSHLNDKENEIPMNTIKIEKKLLNENQSILNGMQESIKSEVEQSNEMVVFQAKIDPIAQIVKKIRKEPKEKKVKQKLQITEEEEKQSGSNPKRSKKNSKSNESIETKTNDSYSNQPMNSNNLHSFSANQQSSNCILPNNFQFMPYVNQIFSASMQKNNPEQHSYSPSINEAQQPHHQSSFSSAVADSIQKSNNNVMQSLLNQKYVSTLYGYLQSKAQSLQQSNVFSNLNFFKQNPTLFPSSHHLTNHFIQTPNQFYYPTQFNQLSSQLNASSDQFNRPASSFLGENGNAFYQNTSSSGLDSLKETQLKISESCNLVNEFN